MSIHYEAPRSGKEVFIEQIRRSADKLLIPTDKQQIQQRPEQSSSQTKKDVFKNLR